MVAKPIARLFVLCFVLLAMPVGRDREARD
jgi:hypothetical protein